MLRIRKLSREQQATEPRSITPWFRGTQTSIIYAFSIL